VIAELPYIIPNRDWHRCAPSKYRKQEGSPTPSATRCKAASHCTVKPLGSILHCSARPTVVQSHTILKIAAAKHGSRSPGAASNPPTIAHGGQPWPGAASLLMR